VKGVPADYYVRMHDAEARHWWHRGMRELELALLRSRLRPDARFLDAGCGTGGFLRFLLDSGAIGSATGVDVSTEAVELAREKVHEAELSVASVAALPFSDGSFDGGALNDVLQHVQDEEVRQALCELRRVLRPGAPLVVRTGASHRARHEGRYWRTYDRRTLRAELERNGFVCDYVTHANLVGSVAAELRRRRPAAPTSVTSGIPADPSPLAAVVAGALLRAERVAIARASVPLPFGHTLVALATRP
jgi:SAM-dependent methyltransferase